MIPQLSDLITQFSFLDMPIGVYVVAPDGHFVAYNRPVREMLHLLGDNDMNASLAQFYADPRARGDILKKAIEAEERGGHLEKEILVLRVAGRELYVEDYCKPLRDPATREIVGYVGCLVDVTEEHEIAKHEGELQNKVAELTFDIGRVLHANTSTLLMAQQTLDGAAEALSRRPLKDVLALSLEDVDEQLIHEAEHLANAIEKFANAVEPERRLKALSEAQWANLTAKISPLRRVSEMLSGMEMRSSALRRTAHEILLVCQSIAPGAVPRELTRDVLRVAAQVESSACLIDIMMTRAAIIQMDSTLRSLRDFITADVRKHEERKRLSLKHLIEQAITHMIEFATSSRVDIVRKERDFDAEVEGIERDLVRALQNLLHNAIKYSWRRDRARAPWITVRTFARDQFACVEFENWGVPISQEEIDNALIFQLGYRGKWSKDRGRLGTGIGMTDAKRVAQEHRGDVLVASRPAVPGAHRADAPDYYNQPFITTVTFCLPQVGKH